MVYILTIRVLLGYIVIRYHSGAGGIVKALLDTRFLAMIADVEVLQIAHGVSEKRKALGNDC